MSNGDQMCPLGGPGSHKGGPGASVGTKCTQCPYNTKFKKFQSLRPVFRNPSNRGVDRIGCSYTEAAVLWPAMRSLGIHPAVELTGWAPCFYLHAINIIFFPAPPGRVSVAIRPGKIATGGSGPTCMLRLACFNLLDSSYMPSTCMLLFSSSTTSESVRCHTAGKKCNWWFWITLHASSCMLQLA